MTPEEVVSDTIEHYGVKGMRWGVRRGKTSGPSPGASEDSRRAYDARAKVGKKGNTDKLSNSELRALVDRMNLERQFSTLSSQSKQKSPAKKFVSDVLVNVGKQQVQQVVSREATKQVAKLLS